MPPSIRLPRRAYRLTLPYRRFRRALRRRHNTVLQGLPKLVTPTNWTFGPPDFVGVGAHKWGTSWWYTAIRAHPSVFRAPGAPKETHFFDRFWSNRLSINDVARYHELFPRPPGALTGEWTPRYMYDFWTAPLLKRAAPKTRLLVLLRDPIDRFRSVLTIHEMRERHSLVRVDEAFERGLYYVQLARLLEHFERDHILVLQYARCRDRLREELRRIYAFLGLDDTGFVPKALDQRINRTRAVEVEVELAAHIVKEQRAKYTKDTERLLVEFPELDRSLWTTLFPA
jgi:hypothetical protein